MRPVLVCLVLTAAAFAVGCDRQRPDVSRPGPAEQKKAAARPEWSADMQAVADGSNAFAFDLYRKLAEKPGNVFFSPFSVHAALAMTADGAKGVTRDEMAKVLHLPADPETALAAGDVGRYYAAGGDGYELAVANVLWGQKGFPWRPEFLDRQGRRFGAGFHEADFRANHEAERLRINQWVEGQTRDRIKKLLAEGTLDTLTRMVLANAIYFKGEWAEQFEKRQTRNAPFTLADGSTKPVSMMTRSKGPVRVRFGDDVSVAELPYKGGEMSMVVVLPTKPDGLPAVEKAVNAMQVATWLGQAREAIETPILLPKFRIESGSRLNDPLKALGMPTVFDSGKADLSGLHQGSERLHVSLVVHKAFGDVSEEGTEAAAATAVVVKGDSGVRALHADHPFLFLIRDVKHGTILFMGRYETP